MNASFRNTLAPGLEMQTTSSGWTGSDRVQFESASGYALLRGEGEINTKKITIQIEATSARPAVGQQ